MINDMTEGVPPLGRGDLAVASTLEKYQVSRLEAHLWAVRDCKFLIFDDTDSKAYGYDSDDEDDEAAMQRALEMSMQTDEAAERPASFGEEGKAVERLESEIDTASQEQRKEESDCTICSPVPEFPHHRRTRKFRLFRPRDAFPELLEPQDGLPKSVDICMHYVAISYCWPIPQKDEKGNDIETPRTYQVRDLDGTTRPNRALDDVLDRAVDVANSCGLRMIWIDQECLPQPKEDSPAADKHDQQLGVQAMDIVYNRAAFTAGLLDLQLSSQAQINAIRAFISEEGDVTTRFGFSAPDPRLPYLLDFLDALSRDRWYTRAWVVQEAISAGKGLTLVFRRAAGLAYPSSLRTGSKAHTDGLPRHSLDTEQRACPSEVVCIPVQDFQWLVRRVKLLLDRTSFTPFGSQLVRASSLRRPADQIVAAAGSLHPINFKPKHGSFSVQMFGGNAFGTRPTVDAAGALALLKTRGCRDVEDRIAIMANMCGYEYRLDTKGVAVNCNSLRVALLALSLLNGDLSLLAPEVYTTSSAEVKPQHEQVSHNWLYPFDKDVHTIDQITVRGFNVPQTQRQYELIKNGLCCSAYLWKIEDADQIDLMPIKIQWEREWAEMKCLRIFVDTIKDETHDQFRSRERAVTYHFSRPGVMRAVKEELLEHARIRDDSPVWRGVDQAGVTIESHLVADRVEAIPEMQLIFSRIVFGVLRFLFHQSDEDPRTLGLANSIWQSIRVDVVDDTHLELPDTVSEALFDHPAVVETPFKTLLLDKDRDGGYHQVWLIDRIMLHGSLWVGRYLPSTSTMDLDANRTKAEPERLGPAGDSGAGPSHEGAVSDNESGEQPKSILHRQLVRRLTSKMWEHQIFAQYMNLKEDKRAEYEASVSRLKSGPWAAFGDVLVRNFWTAAAEEQRAHELVSVFDVDGPCYVATPYSAQWEMIPHPSLRSMSICWVVQAVAKPDEEEDDIHGASGVVVEPAKREEQQEQQEEQGKAGEQGTFQVAGKVKGMWQVMETPSQSYHFV